MMRKIDPEATLYTLLPKAAGAILASDALFLIVFYLEFGELAPFAWGFTVFLTAFQILLIVALRFRRRTDLHTGLPLRNDWIDKIGAWWLMACAFGAFFGWICGQMAIGFPNLRIPFLIADVTLTFLLPIVTMLPNLRYITRNAAYVQVPILVFVTLLPTLVGISAALKLWSYFMNLL